MKLSKLLPALCLFILSVPLFSQEYLIRVDFDEYKLFLINDVGIVIAAYPVAIPGFAPNYLPAYGVVTGIKRNPRWYPTERIRGLYLKQHGEELPKIIEPGDPRNAMGAAQIKIKFNSNDIYPTIRIHGT
ncbi:MAG: hypothetical protein Q8N56_02995, partial [bacterium]|nr:hypothetical protein [bacterium]